MNNGYFALYGDKLKGTVFPELKLTLNDQNLSSEVGLYKNCAMIRRTV